MQHTALYTAVKRGDSIAVRHLLSAGVDPNGAPGLATPLSAAAARGNTSMITLLLDAGAKPDEYAVQVAAFGNHTKALRLLLAAGGPTDGPHGPLLNTLKWSGLTREQQARLRQLLKEAGARDLPDWYLQWRWSIRYGWRWRLRRLLYCLGWLPKQRRNSN